MLSRLALSAALLGACTSHPGGGGGDPAEDDSVPTSDDSSTTDDSSPADTGEIVTIRGDASVRLNPSNEFSAFVEVTLDHDATVVVRYGENDLDHETPPVEVTADVPTQVLILGLRAGRSYEVQALGTHNLATWTSQMLTYATPPLDTGWPTCTPTFFVDEGSVSEDEVVCSQGTMATGQHMYYCTDYWGEPTFVARTPSSDSLMSFEPLMDGSFASTSFTASKIAFFDRSSLPTAEYAASYFADKTRFVHDFIDSHEIYQLRSGKWAGAVAFLTGAYEELPDKSYKLGNGLVIFDPITRTVLYDYSFHGELGDGVSMDEMLPYSRAGLGDSVQDWTHANSVLLGADADGREYFLLSLKAQDWIVKLYPDTDELAWTLGFEGHFALVQNMDAPEPMTLSPMAWPYHQHGMMFLDDIGDRKSIFLLDNGYPRHDEEGIVWGLQYSRILELQLDESSMEVDYDFTYGETTGPDWFFSSTCGNAILLPDGARALTMEGEAARMIEVSYPEGERRWEMTCDNLEWCAYQVHWFPSLYDTTWMYP